MANIKREVVSNIIREMEIELDERDYVYSETYLYNIVDECLHQKNDLIDLLSNHPLWNPEKLMIQFDADIERGICLDEIGSFVEWLRSKVDGYYFTNKIKEYHVCNFIASIKTQFFDETMKDRIEMINSYNDNYKLRTNMKASKAIGKICREEGWDKLEGYNHRYAALCDCLNPIKVKRHTCISVNPVDFLLMSKGSSWQSCHYIGSSINDAGCYSSGTISYMLDEHSFIFYTVDASYDGNQIEREPKIQREVFGYNDEVIAQLRLYPQSNDSGAEQIYDNIRAIVQKVIADCLGKSNLWIKSKSDVEDVVEHGYDATCYPDWQEGNPGAEHCSISTLKERRNGKEFRKITFGAEPICITCGCRHNNDENISCCDYNVYYCSHCGARLSEDEVYWCGTYDDDPYCEDCVTYCNDCGRYVPDDQINDIDGRYICDNCLENGDYHRCDWCDEYHHYEDMYTTYDGEYIFCEDCAEQKTFICDGCGETFHNNDCYYDEENGKHYCKDCYNEILEEREELVAI